MIRSWATSIDRRTGESWIWCEYHSFVGGEDLMLFAVGIFHRFPEDHSKRNRDMRHKIWIEILAFHRRVVAGITSDLCHLKWTNWEPCFFRLVLAFLPLQILKRDDEKIPRSITLSQIWKHSAKRSFKADIPTNFMKRCEQWKVKLSVRDLLANGESRDSLTNTIILFKWFAR
jgi:hypothetical protein